MSFYRLPGSFPGLTSLVIACLCAWPEETHSQTQLVSRLSDSTVQVIAGPQYSRSRVYQFFFGKHYRNIWAAPVPARLFNITSAMNGLEALKTGGSYQTKNLRLRDAQGKEFVLRSVDKNPTQKFSKSIQNSFIGSIIRDQTSVIHPYGYYIIPTLSAAAGVYHTNPKLVYIPDDPELGEYRLDFANTLAMLEERPDGDRQEVASFGNSAYIYSSRKAFGHVFADPCHRVDAKAFLRARLFDVLIGDWSRREDQWRWATFPDGEGTLYRGIPRDRDHAFFKLDDGLIPWVFTRFKTNLQSFHHKINKLDGLLLSGQPMDQSFLVFLEEEDFVAVAEELKAAVSDAVIEKALAVWPSNIQELSAPEFRSKLRSRRDQLPEAARAFYRLLAKEVNLPGSDKSDRFLVEHLANGDTRISLFSKLQTCLADSLVGQRTFKRKETEVIRLYGLGGKDTFEVISYSRNKSKLEIYGGEGEDKVNITQFPSRRWPDKRITLYLLDDGDEVVGAEKVKTADDYKPLAEEFNATGWLLRHRLY